jgi:hypothetical protein
MENIESEDSFFIYLNKEEYMEKKEQFLRNLKNRIYLSENIFKILLYSGTNGLYKVLKLNDFLKLNLNNFTKLEHLVWVDDVCWNIYRNLECAIDNLPFDILRLFKISEMEKYIYNIIRLSLVGGDTEGYFNFIEEKNIYVNETLNLLEHNNLAEISEDTSE